MRRADLALFFSFFLCCFDILQYLWKPKNIAFRHDGASMIQIKKNGTA